MRRSTNLKEALFYSKMAIFDRRAQRDFHTYMRAQQLSSDELSALNWERRKALVAHCAEAIPFYQRKFAQVGFEPGDLRTESDWDRLPVLDKEEIRNNAGLLLNPTFSFEQLPESTTGGTTGQPLKTYQDPRLHLASLSWRMLSWWGIQPSDNAGYLYRAVPTGATKMAKDIALFPTKRAYISAHSMSRENMEKFAANLASIKPRYLVGYVGALKVFAKFCAENSHSFPSLAAIWTTASPLTENQRAEFDRVFDAKSYTQYGSCEFYWISAECKTRSGLHIGTDARHVDVVHDTPQSSSDGFGDLLISDLQNLSFPLLRYRIGDRGRMLRSSCGCGLPFPKMDYVRGRISDNLALKDGTVVPGEFWTTVFDDFTDTIASFQIRQGSDLSIKVSYVPFREQGHTDAQTVLARLREQTRSQVEIQLVAVDEIEQTAGKIQTVIKD